MITKKEAESYQKFVDEAIDDKKRSFVDFQTLLIKNIDHLRSFSSTLLTIDLAVVGAIFAALSQDSQQIIINPTFSILGVALLIANAILIVVYSERTLVRENNMLEEANDFFQRTHGEALDLAHQHANEDKPFSEFDSASLEQMRSFAQQEKQMTLRHKLNNMPLWYYTALCYLFAAGLIFVAMGLLDISYLIQLACDAK